MSPSNTRAVASRSRTAVRAKPAPSRSKTNGKTARPTAKTTLKKAVAKPAGSGRLTKSTGSARTTPKTTPKTGRVTPLRKADADRTEKALLLGIDLGTSRSAIISKTGNRRTVESYVGWAKDAVSKKYLQRDVVFGREALDNRLAVDLYRPLEKGVIKYTNNQENGSAKEHQKNLKAARLLLEHMVKLIEPKRGQELFGVIGVPAQATVQNKQALIEASRGLLDSVMIVSEPFSVAYGLDRISGVLVVDIGAGTTDLCRMHGTVPTAGDQLSLDIAGDAVDQKLLELINKKHPDAQITLNMCKQIKEQYGFVSDSKEVIKVTLPVNGKPVVHDITKEVKQACSILIRPILKALHKLVASFDPEFQVRLRHNVILSGGGSLMNGLQKQIEDGLEDLGGGRVTRVEEPFYAGATGALQLALDMPYKYWQQLK